MAGPLDQRLGIGLDSTAMIIEWVAGGNHLDIVLTADTGAERWETYDYLPIYERWMDVCGIEHRVGRCRPRRFKRYPPASTAPDWIVQFNGGC